MVPRKMPVRPPRPNTKIAPRPKSIGLVLRMEPFHMVCSQFRKSSSAGTEMMSVSIMKDLPRSGFMPVQNMWCPYTMALSTVTADMA